MGCCTCSIQAFVWIGVILLMIGLVALISWGDATLFYYQLRVTLSSFCTCYLFGLLAERLHNFIHLCNSFLFGLLAERLHNDYEVQNDNGNDNDIDNENATTARARTRTSEAYKILLDREELELPHEKTPTLVNLLYGLAVLSLGVAGFFLPANLGHHCTPHSNQTEWIWTTNVTKLPIGIQHWAEKLDTSPKSYGATFGYVPFTGITLFQGANYSYSYSQRQQAAQVCLFRSSPTGGPPVQLRDFQYPNNFYQVKNTTVCFQAMTMKPKPPLANIYCSDGIDHRPMKEPQEVDLKRNVIQSFKVWDGMLWFKVSVSVDDYDFDYMSELFEYIYKNNHNKTIHIRETTWGTLVYSLDTDSMVATLHSEKLKKNTPEPSCSSYYCDDETEIKNIRMEAVIALVTSALPMTIISIVLWIHRQVPSMAITTYLGLTCVYMALYKIATVRPSCDVYIVLDDAMNWWFTISGLIWLWVSCHLLLTPSIYYGIKTRELFEWSLKLSSLAYLWGMARLVRIGNNDDDTFWSWLIWNLVGFLPVTLVGIVTQSFFLSVFLGWVGSLSDAARFLQFVLDHGGGLDGNGVDINTNIALLLAYSLLYLLGYVLAGLGVPYDGESEEKLERLALRCVMSVNQWLWLHTCSRRSSRIGSSEEEEEEEE